MKRIQHHTKNPFPKHCKRDDATRNPRAFSIVDKDPAQLVEIARILARKGWEASEIHPYPPEVYAIRYEFTATHENRVKFESDYCAARAELYAQDRKSQYFRRNSLVQIRKRQARKASDK